MKKSLNHIYSLKKEFSTKFLALYFKSRKQNHVYMDVACACMFHIPD